MNKLIIILTVMDVMISLLLIAVILVQQSKDGGFGGAPFGGVGESVFGGQAADHLTKLTVVLTTLFFVVTLALAIVTGRRPGGELSVVEGDPAVTEMSATPDDTSGKVTPEDDNIVLEKLDGELPVKPVAEQSAPDTAVKQPDSTEDKPAK